MKLTQRFPRIHLFLFMNFRFKARILKKRGEKILIESLIKEIVNCYHDFFMSLLLRRANITTVKI